MSENKLIAETIELRIYKELSVFQIAKRLNLGLPTVEEYLTRYNKKVKEDITLISKVNLCDRGWFIFTNRHSLSNIEMAKHLGLSEVSVRRAAKGLAKKKHIFIKNNNAHRRAGKICLNLETGIFYSSVTEAAMTLTHRSPNHVQAMINGFKRNFTSIVIV